MKGKVLALSMMIGLVLACTGGALAQDAQDVQDVTEAPREAQGAIGKVSELSLQDMIRQGGYILWAIMALGFATLVMIVYFGLTVRLSREVPPKLAKRVFNNLRDGDVRGAYQLCEGRVELFARVARAGCKASNHERYVIQDAMESEGERGATELWQKISYLNNIGNIAPLLGLLGTVWGMIGAFGAIALDDAHVKTLTMAFSVSQAMITTAAGLVLAIPAMMVYYYMRGRVIRIVAEVEALSSEIVELLLRSHDE